MIEALISLIPGGALTAIGAAVAFILTAAWRIWAGGKASGRNEAKAERADAYEKHLKELSDAHRARNSVQPGSLPDKDKYRRD